MHTIIQEDNFSDPPNRGNNKQNHSILQSLTWSKARVREGVVVIVGMRVHSVAMSLSMVLLCGVVLSRMDVRYDMITSSPLTSIESAVSCDDSCSVTVDGRESEL